jgi:hypothetical protein
MIRLLEITASLEGGGSRAASFPSSRGNSAILRYIKAERVGPVHALQVGMACCVSVLLRSLPMDGSPSPKAPPAPPAGAFLLGAQT